MADSNPTPLHQFLLPPTRGDKRIMPLPITMRELAFEGSEGVGKKSITRADFEQTRVTGTARVAAGPASGICRRSTAARTFTASTAATAS